MDFGTPTPEEAARRLSSFVFAKQKQQAAIQEAVSLLRARLASGELSSSGLLPPKDAKFLRVRIEPAFWDVAPITFNKNTASALGVEYHAVEVHEFPDFVTTNEIAPAVTSRSEPEEVGTAPTNKSVVAASETRSGGRTNYSDEVKRWAKQLWSESEEFRNMKRLHQAREIRSQMFGEKARRADNMSGCTTDSMRRWIGEELRGKRTDEGEPA